MIKVKTLTWEKYVKKTKKSNVVDIKKEREKRKGSHIIPKKEVDKILRTTKKRG